MSERRYFVNVSIKLQTGEDTKGLFNVNNPVQLQVVSIGVSAANLPDAIAQAVMHLHQVTEGQDLPEITNSNSVEAFISEDKNVIIHKGQSYRRTTQDENLSKGVVDNEEVKPMEWHSDQPQLTDEQKKSTENMIAYNKKFIEDYH